MSRLDNVNVYEVTDLESAGRFLSWLGQRRPVLAIDTETTGLEWWTPHFTRLVQFGDGETGWAVPIRTWRGVAEHALQRIQDTGVATVFHNMQFDLHALEEDGLPLPALDRAHDTATMHRLLYPLRYHSLKGVAEEVLGPDATVGQGLLRHDFNKHGWSWATVPDTTTSYWAYAALDTVLTALVAEGLWAEINAQRIIPLYEKELAVQHIMYRAERRGLRVDPDYTRNLRQTWERERDELRRKLVAAGIDKPGSNQQVNAALKEAGWEPEEFTETGQPKLDKAVLDYLLTTEFAPVARDLLRYRRLTKWDSTYLKIYLTKRDANDRVHASINTMGARTGRMSINKPGLQTLPRGSEIRNCVIPFTDKDRLVSIDYDTMEMRVFSDYTGDPGLIGAIRAGEDMHTFCAAAAYGVPTEAVTKAQRQIAKNVNFARIYGAGPAKIALTAGVPEGEITTYLKLFDSRFPRAAEFIKQVEHQAKLRMLHEGEPYITTVAGRRLPSDPDRIYALLNYLVQGSCADVFKSKLVALESVGLADDIVIPVHDEFIFSFPEKEVEERTRLAHATMEEHQLFKVPLTCEASGPLTRWGDKT